MERLSEMQGFANRLVEIRRKQKLTQEEMADILNVPLRTYQSYEHGRTQPKALSLADLAINGVNLNWLVTGRGSSDLREEGLGLVEEPAVTAPVYVLVKSDVPGWFERQSLHTDVLAPELETGDQPFAVVMTGDALSPVGILPGAVCVCSPERGQVVRDTLGYIQRPDARGAVRILRSFSSKGIVTAHWLSGDDGAWRLHEEMVPAADIALYAPVLWIRASL